MNEGGSKTVVKLTDKEIQNHKIARCEEILLGLVLEVGMRMIGRQQAQVSMRQVIMEICNLEVGSELRKQKQG
jgi:hypothetical protein